MDRAGPRIRGIPASAVCNPGQGGRILILGPAATLLGLNVALDILLNFFRPQFLLCKMAQDISTSQQVLDIWEEYCELHEAARPRWNPLANGQASPGPHSSASCPWGRGEAAGVAPSTQGFLLLLPHRRLPHVACGPPPRGGGLEFHTRQCCSVECSHLRGVFLQ